MAAKPRCHTYDMKKVLFVDSHGIKSFPYRGRRKHFFQAFNKYLATAEIVTMTYLE
jgi:hypothetical protein